MRHILPMVGIVCVVFLAASCVTDKQYNRAIFKVEAAWKTVNEQILETEGKRVYPAAKQQVFAAAQMATSRLGMVVEQQSYDTGFLFISGPAPTPLTMEEWARVQEAETDNLRSIVMDDLGVATWWVTLDPSSKDVLANIFVKENAEGTEVSVGLRLRSTGEKSDRKKRLQPPPTAMQIGLKKFWAALEVELNALAGGGVSAIRMEDPTRKFNTLAVSPEARKKFSAAASARPEAIAVIIGNRDYGDRAPTVEYAHNDADAMRRFMIDYLGVSEDNIIDLRDAKLADMEQVLGNSRTHRGTLWQWIRPAESEVFVYYSGHGMPGLKDGRSYLLPVDADPESAELQGYALEVLYSNLEKLDALSVAVFMDACFSGESPSGPLTRKASGIRVAPKEDLAAPFMVISAAGKEQIASWDEASGHGLFTRHLLDALSGAADGKRYGAADGRITLSETKRYLDREMTYAARRQFGRLQEATVIGDSEKVILTIRK